MIHKRIDNVGRFVVSLVQEDKMNKLEVREELMNYLRADEVAAMLQMSTRQICKMATANKIPAMRIGKFWRFDESKVTQYIALKYRNGYK